MSPETLVFSSGNPAAVEMFKCKDEDDLITKSPLDLSPEYQEDGELSSAKAVRLMEECLNRGSCFFEWKHRCLNGDEFIADVFLVAMDLEGKKLIQATTRDISSRKRVEEDLALEKRRLADILKGTNVGTWEWNVQTGETIFNERWAGIIGYSLKELSPVSIDTWMKFAHPDDLKVSGAILEKHFKGELDYYECEARMLHKNGDWIWVLDRGKVSTWTKGGKPLLMSGTHQDISDRKQAVEALRESEQRFRMIVNNA
ncbi:MAG: PAS domain S-box protein, partial [bacterium]|nr:PAS domain S-box protein [bacterium]